MNELSLGCWPGGRNFAVTFSYDDGRGFDRQLVEIFNRHGMKGTFNLNSGFLGHERYVSAEEVAVLYAGHEVAVHTCTHPHPTRIPSTRLVEQVVEDRKKLEALTGGVVDGMAYPFGDYNEEVMATLKACGIRYSRTTTDDRSFRTAPGNWLAWHPTCHDRNATPDLIDAFFNVKPWAKTSRLLYIWGHSYEFDRPGGWEAIDGLCGTLKERGGKDAWFATNMQVYDYVAAVRALHVSADGSRLVNNAAFDVWVTLNNEAVCVPGTTGNQGAAGV